MMAVVCSHCGEELLGAVNRCWRCGHAFAATPGNGGLPPVRRPPIREDGATPVMATFADGSSPKRRPSESPFTTSAKRTIRSSRTAIRDGSSLSAVILGLLSLLTSAWTLWSSVPACLGFALGLSGLRSNRFRMAVFGLLLCCIALSVCLMRSIAVYDAYQQNQLRREFYGEEFR